MTRRSSVNQKLTERLTQPASVRAGEQWCESSIRARGSTARQGVPVRRIQVAEVGKRRQGSEKRVPGGNGTRGREPKPGKSERACWVAKASTTCIAVAKPRGSRRPEPGARKGVAGRRFLSYGRHLGPFSHTHRFTRSSGGQLWWFSDVAPGARATLDQVWEPRQGCQKRVRTLRGRKTTPPAMNDKPIECGPPKRVCPGVNQAIPRAKTSSGTREARVLVRRSEKAKVGPTHRRASAARGAARQIGSTALAQRRSARRADARSGGQPRGENGVRGSVTLSTNETSAARRPGQPGARVTRRKAFRPSRVSFRKGRSAGRSWSRGSNPEVLAPRGAAPGQAAVPAHLDPAAWCPRRRQGTSDAGNVQG